MFAETKFFHKAGEGSGGGGGGCGGSDPHNKGYFATPAALRTAYPTAQPGDFAIVESTDTVWVWDSDTSGWKDGDTKGQVISVNNQTGAVTLTASDVGAATAAQGAKADTAVQPGNLATVATTGAYSDLTGTPTIPTVGDGTITITQGGVTKGTFTTNQSGNTTIDVDAGGGSGLPDQTGNAGKFLTTDGTDASWATVDTLPSQTGQSGRFLTTDGTDASWATINALQNTATGSGSIATGNYSQCTKESCVVIGGYAKMDTEYGGKGSVVIGWQAEDKKSGYSQPSVVIGYQSKVTAPTNKLSPASCAIGVQAESNAAVGTVLGGIRNKVTGDYAIQIGGVMQTNSETGTLCIGSCYNNAYVNYKMMDADGTIPTDRYTTTPSADGTYVPALTISSGVATRAWADLLTALSTISGYDATKTQSLKNVQGVLTWVDD